MQSCYNMHIRFVTVHLKSWAVSLPIKTFHVLLQVNCSSSYFVHIYSYSIPTITVLRKNWTSSSSMASSAHCLFCSWSYKLNEVSQQLKNKAPDFSHTLKIIIHNQYSRKLKKTQLKKICFKAKRMLPQKIIKMQPWNLNHGPSSKVKFKLFKVQKRTVNSEWKFYET